MLWTHVEVLGVNGCHTGIAPFVEIVLVPQRDGCDEEGGKVISDGERRLNKINSSRSRATV